jgi:radical SAM enzyme (TIGR01210 family)
VLLKPRGLSERGAIEDSVGTLAYLAALKAELGGTVYAALEPVFVQKGTALYADFVDGRYQPPWLWSVVEVLRRSAGLALDGLRVGTPDEFPPPMAIRENRDGKGARCGCSDETEMRIAQFNKTRDASVFDGLECGCRDIWKNSIDEVGKPDTGH